MFQATISKLLKYLLFHQLTRRPRGVSQAYRRRHGGAYIKIDCVPLQLKLKSAQIEQSKALTPESGGGFIRLNTQFIVIQTLFYSFFNDYKWSILQRLNSVQKKGNLIQFYTCDFRGLLTVQNVMVIGNDYFAGNGSVSPICCLCKVHDEY